jgi:SAM-dependent methyltransferase
LGYLPLSNNLAESTLDKVHNERYPLEVLLCEKCGLSQLSIVIPPEQMFSHYVYRSGISQGYINHCKQMAADIPLNKDCFHIDIAGNDGTLLQQFKERYGHNVLNIDPAVNLVGICEAAGIPVLNYFWGMDVARRIVNSGPRADLITATNVFAHVDNVNEFIQAAKYLLKPTGILVMEFPYLIDFIEGKEFDTVYFEHLSYFSIYPLTILCESTGLTVMNVTKQNIHGGSVRVIIGFGDQDETVAEFVKNETKYRTNGPYIEFAEDVQLAIQNFRGWVLSCQGTIAGFAASAKGNTLLNCAGITCGSIRYIVDDTPEKIGKYSPGTRIPIVAMRDMLRNPPDYLVILSWNFGEEIMSKCRIAGYTGKFVIPIPELKVID